MPSLAPQPLAYASPYSSRPRIARQARPAWRAIHRSLIPVRRSAAARASSVPWRRARCPGGPPRPLPSSGRRRRRPCPPTMTSPAWTMAPAQTTGTLTEPGVALTVPWALIALAQTGNSIAVRSATSRTPASMIRPTTPCARADTASSSPNIPSVDSDVVVTTRTSPALAHVERRMDHQVVAGLTRDREGAAADFGRRVDRPHIGAHQSGAALRFVNGGDAELAERADGAGLGARDFDERSSVSQQYSVPFGLGKADLGLQPGPMARALQLQARIHLPRVPFEELLLVLRAEPRGLSRYLFVSS